MTAATGIDAMVHAIEAYTSRHKKNPISDGLARQALALLSANIREACPNGANMEARGSMLLGSMLAGMAFANAPVAAVHALAYPIGAIFHVPHGLSNALVLMGVLRFNLPEARRSMPNSRPFSIRRPTACGRRAGAALRLRARSHLPGLQGAGLAGGGWGAGKPTCRALAEDAMKQTRLLVNNPCEVTYPDAYAIYSEALDGKKRQAA